MGTPIKDLSKSSNFKEVIADYHENYYPELSRLAKEGNKRAGAIIRNIRFLSVSKNVTRIQSEIFRAERIIGAIK